MTPAERRRLIHRKLLANLGPHKTDAMERMVRDGSVTITIERGVMKISSIARVAPLIRDWMASGEKGWSIPL